MEPRYYAYKGPWWAGPAILLFFGLATLNALNDWLYSTDTITLFNVIELGRTGSSIVLFSMVAFGFAMVVLGLISTYIALQPTQLLVLEADRLIIPPLIPIQSAKVIPYQDIQQVRLREMNRMKSIEIIHRTGKVEIVAQLLSKEDFQEVYEVVSRYGSKQHRIAEFLQKALFAPPSVRSKRFWIDYFWQPLEAKIALVSSILYLLMGTILAWLPAYNPFSSFSLWFFKFMPILIFLFYIKLRGFKHAYVSTTFNKVMMGCVIAMPLWAKLSTVFR